MSEAYIAIFQVDDDNLEECVDTLRQTFSVSGHGKHFIKAMREDESGLGTCDLIYVTQSKQLLYGRSVNWISDRGPLISWQTGEPV